MLFLLISIIGAYCTAVLFVEKRNDYPIKKIHRFIRRKMICVFGGNFARMIYCSICTSFWMALLWDIALLFCSHMTYWAWPGSGLIAAGLTWTIYQFLPPE
jgi:hypothetical protein